MASPAMLLTVPAALQPSVRTGVEQVGGPDAMVWWPLAWVLLVATAGWMLLRWRRAKSATAADVERRMGRGLGRGLVALGSILQPQGPAPAARPDYQQVRHVDPGGRVPEPDRAPVLFEDGRWPADGLRTSLHD